jgi:hypothetical protein
VALEGQGGGADGIALAAQGRPQQRPQVEPWIGAGCRIVDRRERPEQTKVSRFASSRASRSIVGQPRSTLDPAAWLRDGAIVLVNTAKGTVGEDTAGLVGGSLINLVALLVGEQARLAPSQRRPVTLIVDEMQTIPGADFEAVVSELAKFGGNLLLSTQSLGRLQALDRAQQRALEATLFSNVDGLFVFNVSAADARFLVPELGGGIEDQDVLEMGDHRCYVRLSTGGERLPAFSVHLDPPPASDAALARQLATESAALYGRDRAAVERALLAALARLEGARRGSGHALQLGPAGAAPPDGVNGVSGGPGAGAGKARNEHRLPKLPKRTRPDPQQPPLFGPAPGHERPGPLSA